MLQSAEKFILFKYLLASFMVLVCPGAGSDQCSSNRAGQKITTAILWADILGSPVPVTAVLADQSASVFGSGWYLSFSLSLFLSIYLCLFLFGCVSLSFFFFLLILPSVYFFLVLTYFYHCSAFVITSITCSILLYLALFRRD